MLQPQVGDSASAASQGSLPFGNGGQKQEVLLSLGQSKRPPHARRAREALMRVHDSSTRAPTVAATAVAIMLAFAPAKAAGVFVDTPNLPNPVPVRNRTTWPTPSTHT